MSDCYEHNLTAIDCCFIIIILVLIVAWFGIQVFCIVLTHGLHVGTRADRLDGHAL